MLKVWGFAARENYDAIWGFFAAPATIFSPW
jgi:hypothetical protein